MNIAAELPAITQRRIPVVGDRVECPRIASVDIDRCRECAYLLRVETADSDGTEVACVVCSLGTGGRSDIESLNGGLP